MIKVGIVGWRGMVGSFMIERMIKKNDFDNFKPFFFSTSQLDDLIPKIKVTANRIENAYNIKKLADMKIIISCKGSKYTRIMHKKLRNNNWKGYWLDTASELRMNKQSIIVLDPVNRKNIDKALKDGILNYIGGNCTVSLMLMAFHGLIKKNWVEWITSMTYQAVSGAGANKVRELLLQMRKLGNDVSELIDDKSSSIFEINEKIKQSINSSFFPLKHFNKPIAGSLIPWIDISAGNGQTREEWKGYVEANKILALRGKNRIYIDGQCVRIGTIRCHSQALTIKLKRNIPIKDIETSINSSSKWVKIIPNNEKATINDLNPTTVSGTLNISVGRLRKLTVGNKYLTAFTVADQLLWGAVEPIRRTLNIIISHIS